MPCPLSAVRRCSAPDSFTAATSPGTNGRTPLCNRDKYYSVPGETQHSGQPEKCLQRYSIAHGLRCGYHLYQEYAEPLLHRLLAAGTAGTETAGGRRGVLPPHYGEKKRRPHREVGAHHHGAVPDPLRQLCSGTGEVENCHSTKGTGRCCQMQHLPILKICSYPYEDTPFRSPFWAKKDRRPARLRRSPNTGGEYRTRTCDPLHVKQML